MVKSNRISPVNIISLKPNEVFVFGSNMAGRHGKGAAKEALKFGAIYGKGYGIQGQSYAIPTKDMNLLPLDVSIIQRYVDDFIEFASLNYNYNFLVTKIGCGLAGFNTITIAPLFNRAYDIKNIYLPKEFADIIEEIRSKDIN